MKKSLWSLELVVDKELKFYTTCRGEKVDEFVAKLEKLAYDVYGETDHVIDLQYKQIY